MSVARPANRLDAWLPASLLFAGTLAFIGAGGNHPRINSSLGVLGSDQFYRAFAEHMLHTPNWQGMHLLILLGPVFWALGTAGAARLLPARVTALTQLARDAMMLGAALWAVAFVLDGYLAPRYAEALTAAAPGTGTAATRAFSMNAYFMARLGMLSISLLGTGVLALAIALLIDTPMRSWRALVGVTGLAVGAWPLIASMTGEFNPGPFTSHYWTLTAVSVGLWFAMLGTTLLQRRQEQ